MAGNPLLKRRRRTFQTEMTDQMAIVKNMIVDTTILITGCLAVLIGRLYGIAYERGFFCDDDSIKYPFKLDTIPDIAVNSIGSALPTIFIILNEYYESRRKCQESRPKEPISLCGRPIPPFLYNSYAQIGIFYFGACICMLIVRIAKCSVGRLRPHFLDVCKPDIDCSTLQNPHIYISNYTCTANPGLINNARLSFPSGHSAFACYAMVYLVIYLQRCMQVNIPKLVKPLLQSIFISLAWYTSLSRLPDHRHHWDDIFAGIAIGTITAIVTAYFVSDMFSTTEDDECISYVPVENSSTKYNTFENEPK